MSVSHDHYKQKYPQVAEALDNARAMMETANSPTGKHLYQAKTKEFNVLIEKLFTVTEQWNEAAVRYTIVKMQVLHEEIKSMQEAINVYNELIASIERGDIDKPIIEDTDDDPVTAR